MMYKILKTVSNNLNVNVGDICEVTKSGCTSTEMIDKNTCEWFIIENNKIVEYFEPIK